MSAVQQSEVDGLYMDPAMGGSVMPPGVGAASPELRSSGAPELALQQNAYLGKKK
jgi:hypothetical protein